MRNVLFVLAAVLALSTANAQTGKNQLSIGFDLGIPTTSGWKTGFGGTLKYLHGVGEAGQVTLTSGYEAFKAKGSTSGNSITEGLIPVLVGYRQNFSGAYIEPQVGYTNIHVKEEFNGQSSSASTGGFGYAIAAGYALQQGLDLSARYQAVSKDGTFGFIGFRIAYNFSLGGSSK
ncbi:MAG: outer membrane beta-barrel protein [Flavisolibacter sp.]